jgi:outer membrane protein assembly factor BamE (lipoprotein component of BamABCDE complex)
MKKILALVLLLAACAPTIETRGNLVSDTKFKEIQAMTSSRADVEQKWGPPTTYSTLDPNTWYYIGETTAQEGVFAPEVEKRRLIRVKFDASDKVTEIAEIDPKKGKDIDPVDRRTPTAGREYTVFQQFIGNLGKFNKDGAAKNGSGNPGP